MNQRQIAGQYRQSSTQGVNRVGLVVRLYDAILEDLRRAARPSAPERWSGASSA